MERLGIITGGVSFGPIRIPPEVHHLDVYSDPVEGIARIDVGNTMIGGPGSYSRLSGADNEYRTVGNPSFGNPNIILQQNYPLYTSWRLQVMDVSNLEKATVWYRKIRYGDRFHVFAIDIK